MAMRPPVPVPTLSRRAKLVIGAIAVLLVLFTADRDVDQRLRRLPVVRRDRLHRGLLDRAADPGAALRVAGVATGGLIALAIYLAYRLRPTFRPMSLGAAEPRALPAVARAAHAAWSLIAVAVVLGLFAGFTAQGSWADLAAASATAASFGMHRPAVRHGHRRSSSSTTRSTGSCSGFALRASCCWR